MHARPLQRGAVSMEAPVLPPKRKRQRRDRLFRVLMQTMQKPWDSGPEVHVVSDQAVAFISHDLGKTSPARFGPVGGAAHRLAHDA